MVTVYANLTTASGCIRVPLGEECSDELHRADMLAQDRADQSRRDSEAIDRAVARGVIDP